MRLPDTDSFLIILIVAAGTAITRFLPFLLFPDHKKVPGFVLYLGKALPLAAVGLLVVYCLRSVTFTTAPFGIPEIVAVAVVVALHLWKRNTFLSIGAGTAVYIFLVQAVFL